MDLENKIKKWKAEEKFSFQGWDFSHLKGRWEDEKIPWDYRQIIEKYLREDYRLLDMGTGGGEFVLSLNHNPKLISVTEGYLPNFKLCKEKLSPMGIEVEFVEDDNKLNFPNNSFDLVLNRHESFNIEEVARVLKPGGYFISQQIGGKNDRDLSKRLIKNFKPKYSDNILSKVLPNLEKNDFEIIYSNESFTPIRFFDTGALVYFAKIIEWEFPNFSVDKTMDELIAIDKEIEKNGFIEGTEHRYVFVARLNK
ncbi:class I SAM-dependent methyltransferase [Miniphocaeibacter halophilus]|uniref:Class I SAM-dependent methyltransferase n=1 Tax=Miniphocaeibacter halophilus TaxID=2931922 RepID=A0AC61MM93_9FIRM|nr:class I SAM-dependent methyltransferase [Miniphocaeibacter halophilus]QQK06892.1 class I SAM-dependent methyltransferase [Miniphocaeibacter halophilus]